MLSGKGKAKGGTTERTYAEVAPAEAARVSGAQVEMVLRLEEAFRGDIEAHHLTRLLEEIEIPLIPVLVDMEASGILVDRVLLGAMSRGFNKELTGLELDIYKAAGSNCRSRSEPRPAPRPTWRCSSSSPRWATKSRGSSSSTAS